jgi:predicted ATP-dependent endonuclease of OLD family
MVLHARRKKHPANSYLYLFDEPGVFLHPKGQKDLIQVFEQLSDETQIVYATHSLFMLNQNFPERHRLITRDSAGTKVDQKPYRANWRLATDALGVHLTANILFSPSVLLVEGDSDPLYLYELFRALNSGSHLDADANMLGILSYNGDLPNLRYLLQTFKNSKSTNVMVLYDGDKTGKNLAKAAKELCERLEVSTLDLEKNKSIEDYILFPDIFIEAAEETIRAAAEAENIDLPGDFKEQLLADWTAAKDSKETTRGKWFKDTSRKFLNNEEASKVALARNYAFRCREVSQKVGDGDDTSFALSVCREISKKLKLPSIKAKQVISA